MTCCAHLWDVVGDDTLGLIHAQSISATLHMPACYVVQEISGVINTGLDSNPRYVLVFVLLPRVD